MQEERTKGGMVREGRASTAEAELASFGLVHDLRSPLAAAASAFQVLEVLLGQGDADTLFFRDAVRKSLHRAAELVDGWHRLLASTCAEDRAAPVDLAALVGEVLAELGMHRRQADLTLSVGRLPTVVAQRFKIHLALYNLLDNARLYRREGIPLIVHIGSRRRGPRHTIFVRDNGRGIPPAYHATIFEPFQRVQGSPGAGLGLGLSLVRRVIEQHGGSVWLRSRVGVGTTVSFTL
jgi:signal transduction histidine kinase